ncbi:FG-GAP-like repeat-containing protein [Fuerstiella marisgermanici]|uniref:Putative PEP-CTERM system TPR-repeat lipoprotein n=1 Tax=Fuerstiella marisgermanici TaxID=1891926 RepID=A0A1P8WK22_9PLAN|nr:FG-GAP-like repeat-containing protein [Fuerstiella marisgermanici]APZ94415.1 putative PEP-CTERM system TPR-repeat lipoprotein [Fuerstiella marisgermanici]
MGAPSLPTEQHDRRSRWWLGSAVAVLVIAILGGAYWVTRPDTAVLMQDARLKFLHGDDERAMHTVEQVLLHEPNNEAALVLAGDISFALEEFDQSLAFYRRVPNGDSEAAIHARMRCGRIEMHHTGNAVAAEADFRAALEHVPNDRNALFQLVSLLGIQARRSEAVPFVLRLFRQGAFNSDFLALLQSENGALFNAEELQRYQDTVPDSPGVLVGMAWHARNSGSSSDAIELLTRATMIDPDFSEARIALADLLWESGQHDRLRMLLGEHPSSEIDDPRFWLIRGQLAEHDNMPEPAARCYWETLRRDSTQRNAAYKLFQYFTTVKDDRAAAWLERRIDTLLELRTTSDVVTSTQLADTHQVRRLVEQLEHVGRDWEAWGWCRVAQSIAADAVWAVTKADALHVRLQDAPLTRVNRPAELPFNLSDLPVPRWQADLSRADPRTTVPKSAVTFRDDAESANLKFQYFNDPSPPNSGQRMYEFNGGGCGVLDFDADGHPDIIFPQGCRWDSRGNQRMHIDRLFRNLGGGRFADVTDSASLFENRFSTGVAVGDFDNDGFADCYLANIGDNRLFRNNGDGTFTDATARANVGDPRWSTSCLIADLNGDSLPDIYSVNYLEGESIFETVCQHDDGQPRMCMPFHFPGSQDQLYLNSNDGTFVNATKESGVRVPDGKGLGVVAADWHGRGRLSLLVANDTVANSFFVNRHSPPAGGDSGPIFEERGMTSGIALNHVGRAEGCMGIAIGDIDDDSGLDVFITNFLHESNTLYRSLPGAIFADATKELGLADPSLPMLGFGTQFLDADLDGRLDLIVANGHIDDYRRYGRPYQMAPQLFYNAGEGQFIEQPGSTTGPYFTQQYLGRSLARWDWNGDGREDAVISNLDQPAALLTNTTLPHGRSLTLQLRAVASSRDAIGTTVTATVGERTISRQLTAGDGYQASNERSLVFGLGDSTRVDQIRIAWPSGEVESWENLPGDGRHVVIEGRTRAYSIDE